MFNVMLNWRSWENILIRLTISDFCCQASYSVLLQNTTAISDGRIHPQQLSPPTR